MDEFQLTNMKNWDERVEIHRDSEGYRLKQFKEGELSFVAGEHLEIGDVSGKTLLHLQCHFGLDTMSFSRLGAKATGVDFSKPAIKLAESLAAELGLDTRFVEADVYNVPLDEQFDIVFTSVGVLPWLGDLDKWAKTISRLLKPDGIFFIKDSHPFIHVFDDEADDLRVKYSYFRSELPMKFEGEYSYIHEEGLPKLKNTTCYEWNHSISEIVTALLSNGIILTEFKESATSFFQNLPFMIKTDHGWVLPEPYSDKIPLTFTIKATKMQESK